MKRETPFKFLVILLCVVKCQAQWTWLSGSNVLNSPASYGSPKYFSPSTTPGGRASGGAWKGVDDLVWVYSGVSFLDDTRTTLEIFSDLWCYNLTSNEWAVVSVTNGTCVHFGPDVNPGARYNYIYWPVAPNRVYVFGGASPRGFSSDMFRLDINSTLDPQWTYLSGDITPNLFASYGPIGVEGPNYSPGGRSGAASWIGSDNTLWLFGGQARCFNSTTPEPSNDLWRYNLTSNYWAYMGGSQYVQDPGVYTGPNLWPSAREYPAAWAHNGAFWFFGGYAEGQLVYNEIWYYLNGTWTWVSGDVPAPSLLGVYGDKGIGTYDTKPGGRGYTSAWVDSQGLVWVFGGLGNGNVLFGDMQDTWVFNTTSKIWTFVDGTSMGGIISQYGPIGEEADIPPSGRSYFCYVPINDSFIWLFGGAQLYLTNNFFAEVFQFNTSGITFQELPVTVHTNVTTGTVAETQSNPSAAAKSNAGAIAAGVLVPIFVIAVAGIFLFLWWKKRRGVKKADVPLETIKEERPPSLYSNLSELRNKGAVIIQNKLGEGNFGDVYKGMWNNLPVALKMLKESNHFLEFQKEAELLCSLKNEHIVQYYGTFIDSQQKQYIITELMNRGDAQGMIMKNPNLSTKELVKMCLDAAKGMSFIHSKNIIHRDLALRNLLVTDGPNNSYIVKVSDFGMAKMMEGQDSYYKSDSNFHPIKWCAPETLKFAKYTFQSDIWAYGVLLWEIFSQGATPYPGMTNVEVAEAVLSGYRMAKPEKCPDALYEIAQRCWTENSKERPSMDLIVAEIQGLYVSL